MAKKKRPTAKRTDDELNPLESMLPDRRAMERAMRELAASLGGEKGAETPLDRPGGDVSAHRPARIEVRQQAFQRAWKAKLKQLKIECLLADTLKVIDTMRDAFDVLGRPRVIALIQPENMPSQEVARKLGMQPEPA